MDIDQQLDCMEIDENCVQEIDEMIEDICNKSVFIDGFNTVAQVFIHHNLQVPRFYTYDQLAWALSIAFERLNNMYHVGKKYIYFKDNDRVLDNVMEEICGKLSVLHSHTSVVLCKRLYSLGHCHSSKGRDDFALLLDIVEFGDENSIIISADNYADREEMMSTIMPFDRIEYECGKKISHQEIDPSQVELDLWQKQSIKLY